KLLASGSDRLGAGIWDAATGEQIFLLSESAAINGIAFSQDGRTLATSTESGAVTLWNTATWVEKLRVLTKPNGFTYIALSPDGTQLAAGNGSSRTAIWGVGPTGGREVLSISAHDGKAYDATFDPSGRLIASTGEDGTLKVWDAPTGQLVNSFPTQTKGAHFPDFGPDGERVAAANRLGGVTIWNVDTGIEVLSLEGDGSTLMTVDFSPDGSKLAASDGGGLAYLWDVVSGKRLSTFELNEYAHSDLAFSPDGNYLNSYSDGGIAYSWRGDTSGTSETPYTDYVSSLSVCVGTLWDADFAQDGQLQAVGAADGTAYVFRSKLGSTDVSGYRSLHNLTGHDGSVTGVAFNPEGSILASAGSDGTARLWELDTGDQITTLIDQPVALGGVDMSPDGRYVLTAGEDGMLRIFSAAVEDLIELARSRMSREMTNTECQLYLHQPCARE
ncbi:MAG: WD40 repeat domain-containing protein, partial [Anaerolineales bacterium]